jgi:hypothetical protein
MKTSHLLRIAAIVTLLFFAGHTSGYPWTPDAGPAELTVIDAMKGHSFDVVGSIRTYWDFYIGFGLAISLFQLLQAVVLWQLAGIARRYAAGVRPIIAAFFIAYFINALLALKFLFVIPVVTSLVIALILAAAFYFAARTRTADI